MHYLKGKKTVYIRKFMCLLFLDKCFKFLLLLLLDMHMAK